jgi:hypothetical protein
MDWGRWRLIFTLPFFWVLVSGACTVEPQTAQNLLSSSTPAPTQAPSATIVWFPPTPTHAPLPTVEVLPTPDQRPGQAAMVLNETFTTPAMWQTGSTAAGSISVGNNELTLAISSPKASLTSLRSQPVFDNFYVEVTANPSLCRGNDSYGLMLRATNPRNGYRFLASCSGMVRAERLKNGEVVTLQNWAPSGEVPPGAPAVVRLGVWAYQHELRFFADDVFQFSISDPVWSEGLIGITAQSAGDTAVTVSFTDLTAYTLDVVPTPTSNPLLSTATPTPKIQ